ncbi:MAG: hypothetical protein F6J89_13735 [Symploca sp. SIO1C4]|uniref:Uncharacterized protein n=1 Tax=Symploca sp. SIO1C4 TaxID=2607765 RepID=A0A6B3N4N1_9CYAN|nr:hypothetical protein [Symploca sp. SIO1C4]
MSHLPQHLEIDLREWKDGNWQTYELWESSEIPVDGVEIPTQEGTYKITFTPSSETVQDEWEVVSD